MKISSGLFIDKDVLVDPFMTDLQIMVFPEPAGYLLRAPFLADQRLNQVPGGSVNSISCFLASAQSKLLGLFGSIASLPSIPSQLSADRRFVNLNNVCDLRLIVSCFQKSIPKGILRINLVSLFLGKLLVETHTVPVLCRCPCSFTLVGLRSIDATAAYLLFQPLKLHLRKRLSKEFPICQMETTPSITRLRSSSPAETKRSYESLSRRLYRIREKILDPMHLTVLTALSSTRRGFAQRKSSHHDNLRSRPGSSSLVRLHRTMQLVRLPGEQFVFDRNSPGKAHSWSAYDRPR